ncbi:MAG: hypothetical protein IKS49_06605 [Actinomycetaceae bacterium]|nr:hypothetical protein [Actinomycetaceae bacterium]
MAYTHSRNRALLGAAIACCAALSLAGCSNEATPPQASPSPTQTITAPTREDITVNETLTNDVAGEHVIEADATKAEYTNIAVVKTGDSGQNDEADFYGDNSAIFATNGATLNLRELIVNTDGTHANAIFSYGEGTSVTIADSVIETQNDMSGGLMTTGGGTMNAQNLRVTTHGNSSAAIRSDRGGGTVNVTGGIYTTNGRGSPAIYSTADITVNKAQLEATASEGVVIEGKNSVSLNDVVMIADHNVHNSDKSNNYNAVMIYQSMSGDAAEGQGDFSMSGGSLTNVKGDIFFVNNTIASITLEDVKITNNDKDGVFLRAAAAGWGTEGSNGGQLDLHATKQRIDGNLLVDEVSNLNLYLGKGSTLTGAINPEGAAGEVYVEMSQGATWTLTADSYISSLTAPAGTINLNGHTLYVDGTPYKDGTASKGSAIEHKASVGGFDPGAGGPGGGQPPMDPGGGNGVPPTPA